MRFLRLGGVVALGSGILAVIQGCTENEKLFFMLWLALLYLVGGGGVAENEAISSTAIDVTENLVAEWTLNEGSGNTAIDSSVNTNNGAISGAVYVTGVSGTALSFDGNDFVRVTDDASLEFGAGSFSISAWMKTSINSSQINIIGTNWAASTAIIMGLFNGLVNFLAINAATGISFTTNQQFSDGNWHHVVIVKDSAVSLGHTYVDGKLVKSDTDAGATLNTTRDWTIGARQNPAGVDNDFFDGLIDQVRVYNDALTSTKVLNLCIIDKPSGFTCG